MELIMKDGERIDDLQLKGLRIIQDKSKFCFGTDAILLSSFARVSSGDMVADLGTGTGIIPILLCGKTNARYIRGIEIQHDMVDMARRSVALNGLKDRVDILEGDIKIAHAYLEAGSFDVVVSNPPYKKVGSGMVNPNDKKAIARHEILCTLKDVISAASRLLRFGGRFSMVHRPDRLIDIVCGMREYNIEPKRIQMVHKNQSRPPSLVLIEGILGGKPSLDCLPPLFIYDEDGNYTPQLCKIYGIDMKSKVNCNGQQ